MLRNLSVSASRSVELTMAVSHSPIFCLRKPIAAFKSICFINNQTLVSGSTIGEIDVWDLSRRKIKKTYENANNQEMIVQLSKEDRSNLLIGLSRGRGIFTINTESIQDSFDLIFENSNPTFCGFGLVQHDGLNAIAMAKDENVSLYDLNTRNHMCHLKNPSPNHGMPMCIRVVAHNSSYPHVAVGFENGEICVWDFRKPNEPYENVQLFQTPVTSFDVSLDGTLVAGTTDNQFISRKMFTDYTSESSIQSTIQLSSQGIERIVIDPESSYCYLCGWNLKVHKINMKTNQVEAVFSHHFESLYDIAIESIETPSLGPIRIVAVSGKDSQISFWRI